MPLVLLVLMPQIHTHGYTVYKFEDCIKRRIERIVFEKYFVYS